MKDLAYVFNDSPIRTVVIRGEPWFVAKDISEALGYSDTQAMTRRLDTDDISTCTDKSSGQGRSVSIVNESGLYAAILGSNKLEAKAFKRWITAEVLPSIRKTGKYAISKSERAKSTAARNALTEQWQLHGADAPHHFSNLTKDEYKHLFGNRNLKKENMTQQERAVLMVFESVEYLKLIQNQELQGYRQLANSLESTAKQLPLFTVSCIGGNA